jgi:anti-sigma factor RsiW
MIFDELACQELVEVITDYLEGKLPPHDRARFETHLAECPGCHTYLAQMQQTIGALRRLEEDALPATTREDLLRLFRSWKRE